MRSTKGIKIDSAVAQEGGLQWNKVGDRTFRLIDAKNGVTLGCKLIPKLLKINLEIVNDIIHFTITGLFKLISSLIFTEQSSEQDASVWTIRVTYNICYGSKRDVRLIQNFSSSLDPWAIFRHSSRRPRQPRASCFRLGIAVRDTTCHVRSSSVTQGVTI